MKSWLIRKDPGTGNDRGHEEQGMTEAEIVGCYHQLNAFESEQIPGDSRRMGKPGKLQSMVLQRVRHDLATQQQQRI